MSLACIRWHLVAKSKQGKIYLMGGAAPRSATPSSEGPVERHFVYSLLGAIMVFIYVVADIMSDLTGNQLPRLPHVGR